MTPEPYDRAMDARAEVEAQVLQRKTKAFDLILSAGGRATEKPPMNMTYPEKVKAGLGLPPPLERLQDAVAMLWAYAHEVEQFGTSDQRTALRVAVVDLSAAATAIIAHWREQEIKRLEAEK